MSPENPSTDVTSHFAALASNSVDSTADMSAEEHTSRYEKLLRRDAHGAVDYSKGNELVPAAEAHPSSGRQLSRSHVGRTRHRRRYSRTNSLSNG